MSLMSRLQLTGRKRDQQYAVKACLPFTSPYPYHAGITSAIPYALCRPSALSHHHHLRFKTRDSKMEDLPVQEQDLTPALKAEFEAFHKFNTTKWYGQLQEPILPVTSRKYADHVRCACNAIKSLSSRAAVAPS